MKLEKTAPLAFSAPLRMFNVFSPAKPVMQSGMRRVADKVSMWLSGKSGDVLSTPLVDRLYLGIA